MAKIHIERAYIEPHDDKADNNVIEITIGDKLIGEVNISKPLRWLYTIENEDGDLVINNSKRMEAKKWDYLTQEILRDGKPIIGEEKGGNGR